MLEYNDNPQATSETVDAEGWLHTGDLGMDARGYVTVTGRVKEMIIRDGTVNKQLTRCGPMKSSLSSTVPGKKFLGKSLPPIQTPSAFGTATRLSTNAIRSGVIAVT